MPYTTLIPWLVAVDAADPRAARLKAISDNWGSGGAISVEWVLIAAGLLLLLIAGLSLRAWWRTRHLRSSPLTVFHQVARACGLSAGERLLLWRIARRQGLTPLTLMLSPATLRHHAQVACDGQPRAGRAHQLRRVARLRRKLFYQ